MKKRQHVVRKLRDVRINTVQNRRVDLTIPAEILERAEVAAGDSVEIRVTADKRIVLMPLRPNWPPECSGRVGGCLLASGHPDECVTDAELPY